MKKVLTLINGKKKSLISVFNRGFQYGDALFETLVFENNKILFWDEHFARLTKGCNKLAIINFDEQVWLNDINIAIGRLKIKSGVIKLTLSRGITMRGYGFSSKVKPIRVVSVFSKIKTKPNVKLEICETKYGHNRKLAGIKHCNRLEQVLAKQEVKNDGIMLDYEGNVISTTTANIFIIKDNQLFTPNLNLCGINGTRRKIILDIARKHNIKTQIIELSIEDIYNADAVFITNSVFGVQGIKKIDDITYKNNELLKALQLSFNKYALKLGKEIYPIKSRCWKCYFLAVVIIGVIFRLGWFLSQPLNDDKVIEIKKRGITPIIHQLASIKPTTIEWFLILRTWGLLDTFQAGYYQISPKMNGFELLKNIVKGKEVKHRVVLTEGKTMLSYYDKLSNNKIFVADGSFEQVLSKAKIPFKFEGWLFPDSYDFVHKTKISNVFAISYQRMQTILDGLWKSRDKSLPLKNKYEAIILASLIEKETAFEPEKSKISGVFINRLEKSMKLQTDPSVIYALGDKFKPPLKRKDLRIDSPFNTYKYKGLPPMAIGSVSYSSLFSALHPDKSKYLYFVAKKDGSHYFSKTYKEHKQAIKKYLK